jgi:glycosyltransferase involved in cell wall biosynthesis
VTLAHRLRRSWTSFRLILESLQRPASLRRAIFRVAPPICAVSAEPARLLLDVSVLTRHDAGTGIQRVTKALLAELVATPPDGYVVTPVQGSRWRRYRHLSPQGRSRIVSVRPGDVFLGLDLSTRIVPRHQRQLLRWRMDGARLAFVLYDLLPALQPAWFTSSNVRAYKAWLRAVAIHADCVLCISQSVATEFRTWLSKHDFPADSMPKIGWFHLGTEKPPLFEAPQGGRVSAVAARPFVLMVGTIEPRKGYRQALDAFEALWREGNATQLVIVGRIGWRVGCLVERLRAHPELGRRLHWFEDADDATLHGLYAAARGVLVASEAEGFGLPILEAAAHGTPLLLRDLPVFREIAGDGATYFRGSTQAQAIDEMRLWVQALARGTALSSESIRPCTWSESARRLVAHVVSH